jgi:hypothetical protein
MQKMTKRNIKQKVKYAFELLPLNLGRDIAIPMAKWFLAVFIYALPIKNYLKKQTMKLQAQGVDDFIRSGIKRTTLVYDNLASPPTYGDYLYVILVARYLIFHGIKVEYLIVDSDYREDWSFLSEVERENFVTEQVRLANALLDPLYANVERLSWHSFRQRSTSNSSDSLQCHLFMGHILERKPIYNYCFNLISQLLRDKDNALLKSVLFSRENLTKSVDFVEVKGKYVTWACRYSTKWGSQRNLPENEFISMYDQIKKKFPHHLVMIISDQDGCVYFRKLSVEHKLHMLFSKDFSQSFLGDAALILNSDYFFQLRGGGIAIVPMFSVMPYEIIAPLANEVMWSKSKVLSFQRDSQFFLNGMP